MFKKNMILILSSIIVGSLVLGTIIAWAADSSNSISDSAAYFPLQTGNVWTYKVSMVGSDKTFKQRVKVTEPEDGMIKEIIYDFDNNPNTFVYYKQNEEGLFKIKQMDNSGIKEYKPIWKVMPAKLEVGTSWTWEASDKKMRESDKVIVGEKVTVPAGTFDTIIVQSEGINDGRSAYTDKMWYAKDVGFVKDEYKINGKTIVYELLEFKSGK